MADAGRRFTGIHAVLYALFDGEGALWREAMRRQVEFCIGAGVDGIVVLGLASEVAKLTEAERLAMIAWAAEDIAGRVPLGVTVYGNSVAEQAIVLREAEARGAGWVILQPPMVGQYGGAEVIRFFGAVAGLTALTVAVQNAPQLMGRGLGGDDIAALIAEHPNITHLKGEMPVLEVERVIAGAAGRLVVLNGQGGLEMTDNLRAGCAGFVLAPDMADRAVAIHRAWRAGDEAGAEARYADILPSVVFAMRSLEHLVVYGKRIFGARCDIEIHDRAPTLRTSAFGLELAARHAALLGRYGG